MNARRRRPLRSSATAVAASGALLLGCAGILGDFSVAGDASADGGGDDAATTAPDGVAPDAPPSSEAGGDVTVEGHVKGYNAPDTAVANRAVVIVDARQKKTVLTTGADGAFRATGVAPPYDVLVAGDGAGSSSVPPIVVLGLQTPHPRLQAYVVLPPPDGGSPWRSATINVAVAFPTCGTATCLFDLSFHGRDPSLSLGGGVGGGYAPNTTSATATLSWKYADSAVADGDLLVSDESFTHYWYTGVGGVSVQANGTANLATVTPKATAALGPVTVAATAVGVPSDWGQPDIQLSFTYPGHLGGAGLARASGTSIVANVPNLVGGTIGAQASVRAPDAYDPAGYTYSIVSTKDLPLSTTVVALKLQGPPLVTSPPRGGSLSVAAGTIAWSGSSPEQIYVTSFLPTDDAGPKARVALVWSSGSPIDMARLTALGLSLPMGPAELMIDANGKVAGLDAVFDEATLAQPDMTESARAAWPVVLAP